MSFDTHAYVRDLAAAHGLTAEPDDTGHADLTRRAVRRELEDIKRRIQALHDWSVAVSADHEARHAQRPAQSAARAPATGMTPHPATRRNNRRRTHPRR